MADQDREKWNARYETAQGDTEPSPVIVEYAPLARPGRALDLACGIGRNSLFLAENGFQVDAVDISTVAMASLSGRHPSVRTLCTDLDTWILPEATYDLIANIKFLDRRLFPMILKGLKPGGVLIFESFISKDEDPFSLKSNELLHSFLSLNIIHYSETENVSGARFKTRAVLVGIKPGGSLKINKDPID